MSALSDNSSNYYVILNHFLRALCFLLIANFLPLSVSAQVGVNTSTPDPSAILDVQSTDKGVLYPRLTNQQRDGIENPATGLIIFNTTSGCLNMYNGVLWLEICGVIPADYQFIDGIYVSINGDDDTGNGNPDNPYATITKGISELLNQGKDTLLVAQGMYYTSGFTQDTSIVILGGYEDEYWTRDLNAYVTTLHSDLLPVSVNQCDQLVFSGLKLMQDSTIDGTCYGLKVVGSSGIVLESCTLFAGNGLDGEDGATGNPGSMSSPGDPPTGTGNQVGGDGGTI